MTVRRPLVVNAGGVQELPSGDTMSADLLYPPVARTLRWSNGGQGAIGTIATVTAGSVRFQVRLPVTTTRWRILLSNYDTYNVAAKTLLTGKKIIHGDHNRSLTNPAAESGDFVGSTATTIVGSDFTIPADGTQYTGPWVTAAGDQFDANTEHLIGVGFTCASQTLQTGTGRSWWWTNSTSGTDPTVAASGATNASSYIPIDAVIEYDCTSAYPAWLFLSDSIYEGTSAVKAAAVTPTSILRSPPNQWGRINNLLVQNHSLYGVTAQSVANSSHRVWTRQLQTSGGFNGCVIGLGTNDIDLSRTPTNIQTDIMSIVSNVRSIIGTSKPIYLVNLSARNLTGTPETTRIAVNEWMGTIPTGITGNVDMDSALRRNSATVSDAALIATDNTHPTHQGQAVLAALLGASINPAGA